MEPTKEQKATPGPWRFDDDLKSIFSEGRSIAIVHFADDFLCVEDNERNAVNSESEANARLIAAAPDLLEACKAIIRWSEKRDSRAWSELQKEIIAALTKAGAQ